MKNRLHISQSARERDSLHQHLHMYALAATAAGVGVLALAQPGEAEIIYTPVQVTIGANQHYDLDLTGDGTVNFTLKDHTFHSTSGWWGYLFVAHPGGNQVAAHLARDGGSSAYAFKSGARINKQAEHFAERRVTLAYWRGGWWGSTKGGSWISSGTGVSNRYLGLRFKIDGQYHYGWAQLSVQMSPWSETLTGYAYETIPNKPIKAGQEQENDESGEQPGPAAFTSPTQKFSPTLGMLAKGASVLSVWRRQEDESLCK